MGRRLTGRNHPARLTRPQLFGRHVTRPATIRPPRPREKVHLKPTSPGCSISFLILGGYRRLKIGHRFITFTAETEPLVVGDLSKRLGSKVPRLFTRMFTSGKLTSATRSNVVVARSAGRPWTSPRTRFSQRSCAVACTRGVGRALTTTEAHAHRGALAMDSPARAIDLGTKVFFRVICNPILS